MKILVLQGSPRRGGNTDTVLAPMIAAARGAGATVEKVNVARLEVSGCTECFACQKVAGKPGCVVKDDGQNVLAKMLKADVIVMATPVFCWGPSAQLKAVLDRMYCLFKFRDDGGYDALLEGKGVAVVTTAAGPREDGADATVESIRKLAEFSRAKWRGEFVGVSLKSPKETAADAKLLARAERFGKKLAG